MLLKRERAEDLVLYDDHGEAWKIDLDPARGRVDSAAGDLTHLPNSRSIRFLRPDGESLRVPYRGIATAEEELDLDDVVVHFLEAQD